MRAEDNIEVKDISALETMSSQPWFIEQKIFRNAEDSDSQCVDYLVSCLAR